MKTMRHNWMEKYIGHLGLALLFCMAGAQINAAEPAQNQAVDMMGSMAANTQSGENVKLYSAENVLGKDVQNKQGVPLGSIEDIVLNAQRDGISYVVLGHGGILGIGDKQIAVPWADFSVETAPETMTEHAKDVMESAMMQNQQMGKNFKLVLNATPDLLAKCQILKANSWPDQVPSLTNQMSNMTGETSTPSTTRTVAQAEDFDLRRVTNLIGLNVRPEKSLRQVDTSNQMGASTNEITPVGKINDILFNDKNERLIYGIVGVENIKSTGRHEVVTPWESLQFQPTQHYASLQVPSVDTLLAFPYETKTQGKLGEREYAEQIFQAYNQQPQWEALGFVSPDEQQPMQKRSQQLGQDQKSMEKSQPESPSKTY